MEKMWSTEEILGQDKREILVWHHRLNHFYFKYLTYRGTDLGTQL